MGGPRILTLKLAISPVCWVPAAPPWAGGCVFPTGLLVSVSSACLGSSSKSTRGGGGSCTLPGPRGWAARSPRPGLCAFAPEASMLLLAHCCCVGARSVVLLFYTATLPGALGSETLAAHCHRGSGQWGCLLHCRTVGGTGQWASISTPPHCRATIDWYTLVTRGQSTWGGSGGLGVWGCQHRFRKATAVLVLRGLSFVHVEQHSKPSNKVCGTV